MTRLFPLLALLVLATVQAAEKPNLLVVLADDMGYGDTGFTGSQNLKTPHLDALARSGVFCEQGYVASPVCSPSRAGLMTGRDPRRFGYEGNLNKADAAYPTRPELLGLAPGEHTLGDHLRAAGYATALIGKWHLGTGEDFHPNERGFDYFCGMLKGSHTYYLDPNKHSLERNGEPLTEFSDNYITDFFTNEGLAWIDSVKTQPWFAFLSYNAPHGPLQATEEDLALFTHIADERRRTYAAMMFSLDRSVGRIVEYLQENQLSRNTLIVFFSDNGGASSNASWNGPLSGAKGTLREGGVRIPMIWSWPGTLPANTRFDQPVSSLDLLPSFLAAAKADPLPLRQRHSHEDKRNFKRGLEEYGPYDGLNVLPALKGEVELPERPLFWRLQGQTAILQGENKLIRLSHRPAQLFRPATDLAEQSDLALTEEQIALELYQELAEWESLLPTVPLWGSSPVWNRESAKHYDTLAPKAEPK